MPLLESLISLRDCFLHPSGPLISVINLRGLITPQMYILIDSGLTELLRNWRFCPKKLWNWQSFWTHKEEILHKLRLFLKGWKWKLKKWIYNWSLLENNLSLTAHFISLHKEIEFMLIPRLTLGELKLDKVNMSMESSTNITQIFPIPIIIRIWSPS